MNDANKKRISAFRRGGLRPSTLTLGAGLRVAPRSTRGDPLVRAARNGDRASVESLPAQERVGANAESGGGKTALTPDGACAAQNGHGAAVKLQIDAVPRSRLLRSERRSP
jgi:hypothetical protein